MERASLPHDSIKRRKKEVPRWLYCNWKYAIGRLKTKQKLKPKQPPLSPENCKRETHKALIVGLSFPKHLCLPTYSYYRSKCSHLFPDGDSPSLQACLLPFSHRCEDRLEMFDTFSNFLRITRKHKDSISGMGPTAEVSLQAV